MEKIVRIDDKRKFTRVPVHAQVTLRFADKEYKKCETRDLCLCGAWVNGGEDRSEGDLCEVEFQHAGIINNRTLILKGEVVRVEEKGIALVFYDMNLGSYTHLQTIINDNTEEAFKQAEEFLDQIVTTKTD